LFFFTYGALQNKLTNEDRFRRGGSINEEDVVQAIIDAKAIMMEKYGTTLIALGEIQRHIRGRVNLPLGGGPDVLAAMYWEEAKNGQYRGVAGESYILMAQFSESGVQIETVNAYGSSAEPESPHYTDQMELFVNQRLKPMTLDIQTAFAEADTIYNPLRISE
jgi:acyl-homoserine-lactone acylase